MTQISFIVTEQTIKFWKVYYNKIPQCRICGKEFQEGDDVTSKHTVRTKRHPTKHYCTSCLEEGSVPRQFAYNTTKEDTA